MDESHRETVGFSTGHLKARAQPPRHRRHYTASYSRGADRGIGIAAHAVICDAELPPRSTIGERHVNETGRVSRKSVLQCVYHQLRHKQSNADAGIRRQGDFVGFDP
jgi:hypothetical protein